MGAIFDWDVKMWFAPNSEPELLKRWGAAIPSPQPASKKPNISERGINNELIGVRYLYVPFEEKDEAKALGALYDPETRKWYAPNREEKLVKRWGKAPKVNMARGERKSVPRVGISSSFFEKLGFIIPPPPDDYYK